MNDQRAIIEEVRAALLIADSLGEELREALFKKLVSEYIKLEMPLLYEKRKVA